MNISTNISTPELLSYSTILENLISTNLGIQAEMSRAVAEGHCSQDEINKMYSQSQDISFDCDLKYKEIQKELDVRIKKDLRMKHGIRKSQLIMNEFDAFVARKNKEHLEKLSPDLDAVSKISTETLHNLKKTEDD